MSVPIAVTIAGSDSSGGAGIQADLKSFSALGVYGASIVTAVTAQNTLGVSAIHDIPAKIVGEQIDSVMSDLEVAVVKIGMVANVDTINVIADKLEEYEITNVVLDPVMVAESGDVLVEPKAIEGIVNGLFPKASVVTPNLHEAVKLLGENEMAKSKDEMVRQAKAICELGAENVLVKGGHSKTKEACDVLIHKDKEYWFCQPFVETRNTHGTGCSLSSAIAAEIAKGEEIVKAVDIAKKWIHNGIKQADELDVGKGSGPIHHFHKFW